MTVATLDFDRCYAAVSGRDARFEGTTKAPFTDIPL